MKKKDEEKKEDKEFQEKIGEFLRTFTGKKEVLETIEVGLTIEITKLSWIDENSGKLTEMICGFLSRLDEIDSEPVCSFFLNPPDNFQFFASDYIYFTASEAFMAYGKDIVRESFANAVKELTGKYPKSHMSVEEQIYGKPLDNTFIKRDLRPGRKDRADLGNLLQNYQSVFPIWEDAQDLYKTIIKSRNSVRKKEWKEDIKAAFPNLPEDLILRLQPFDEYPDNVSAICSKNGGMSKPEDIALEHAAQLCGAHPYLYRLSTLQKRLTTQKRESQTKE